MSIIRTTSKEICIRSIVNGLSATRAAIKMKKKKKNEYRQAMGIFMYTRRSVHHYKKGDDAGYIASASGSSEKNL